MLRRHFKGMMDTFPDLASRLQRGCDTTEEMYRTHNPQKPNIPAIHNGYATKFSGPFSIESILKKETFSRRIPKSSVLCTLPGTLGGHDQCLKRTRTGFGMKRKSDLEDRICGPADSRTEFRGYMNEQANSLLSTNRYTSEYSTPEIRRVPECHETIRPDEENAHVS
ncbi:hypothetical protein AAFF_G00169150 [Aldrovandia affinis]|uniref:Uncharacterized protein n=1 Tax=Aldrovandia affinis TaxID=143900 RepID=A0AAD7R0F1_9TELE|nr:hypothetical protein AAFF_G00169150 [Aldrovandia affinis]